MAKLVTPATTIVLQPHIRETPTSNWIKTIIGIEYHIQEKRMYIELPVRKISLQIEEFETLIQKCREYIAKLPIAPTSFDYVTNTYYFYPLEPSFTFKLSAGFYHDDSRRSGSLGVTFDIEVSRIDISYDSIGCDFSIEPSDFLQFLDELEREVQAM